MLQELELKLVRTGVFWMIIIVVLLVVFPPIPVATAHTMTNRGMAQQTFCLNGGQSLPVTSLVSFYTHSNVVAEVAIWLVNGDVYQLTQYEFSVADAGGVEYVWVSEPRWIWGYSVTTTQVMVSNSMSAHISTMFDLRLMIINFENTYQCYGILYQVWSY